MNLHEYQAKQLFASFGLPTPKGEVAYNVEDALQVASQLSTARWVVKAQVHAGGRGKAGGVKIVASKDDLAAYVQGLLGTRLVTYQTDAHGQPVQAVLVEETSDIARELYLGESFRQVTSQAPLSSWRPLKTPAFFRFFPNGFCKLWPHLSSPLH